MRKRVLIVALSDVGRDPRVQRQIAWLKPHYDLWVCGFGSPCADGISFFLNPSRPSANTMGLVRKIGIFAKLQAARVLPLEVYVHPLQPIPDFASLETTAFDGVVVNDAEPLPLGFRLAKGAPVVFDAHEYYPREGEDSLAWRLCFQHYMTNLCRHFIPRCAAVTTVCESIASEYATVFGITPPVVIPNTPALAALVPHPIDPDRIRLIHHGAAVAMRHLDRTVEMMEYTDRRFSLDLMLIPSDRACFAALQSRVAARSNVAMIEPVPMAEIVCRIAPYDMGVFLLPPVNFNYRHALPNKFFEFIQARLGVAIGPSPDMATLVRDNDLGVVADDFSPRRLAEALNRLTTDDIARFKSNAHRAASRYCADRVGQDFLRVVAQAIDSSRTGAKGTSLRE